MDLTDLLPSEEKLRRVNAIINVEDSANYLHTVTALHDSLAASYIHSENGVDIGFVNIFRRSSSLGYSTKVSYLSYGIKAEFQGQGYGYLLLKTAVNIAKSLQFKKLQYRVDKDNISSIKEIERSNLFVLKKELKTEKCYECILSKVKST